MFSFHWHSHFEIYYVCLSAYVNGMLFGVLYTPCMACSCVLYLDIDLYVNFQRNKMDNVFFLPRLPSPGLPLAPLSPPPCHAQELQRLRQISRHSEFWFFYTLCLHTYCGSNSACTYVDKYTRTHTHTQTQYNENKFKTNTS